MGYEEFLRQKIEQQTKANMAEFDSYVRSSAGQLKIKNLIENNAHLNLNNLTRDALAHNPYAVALIQKNPGRQNVSEKAFFEFTGATKLPQSGGDAIRFGASKAADFKVGEYYGTQKYIKESGGAQDNQINDAITFANSARAAGKKVIVCIDGGEYAKSKISQRLTCDDNMIIMSADELKAGIDSGRFTKNSALHKKPR